MLAKQWRRPEEQRTSLPNRVFQLKPPYEGFHEYYDEVQDHLEKIARMDEMISGSYLNTLPVTVILEMYIFIQDC